MPQLTLKIETQCWGWKWNETCIRKSMGCINSYCLGYCRKKRSMTFDGRIQQPWFISEENEYDELFLFAKGFSNSFSISAQHKFLGKKWGKNESSRHIFVDSPSIRHWNTTSTFCRYFVDYEMCNHVKRMTSIQLV